MSAKLWTATKMELTVLVYMLPVSALFMMIGECASDYGGEFLELGLLPYFALVATRGVVRVVRLLSNKKT